MDLNLLEKYGAIKVRRRAWAGKIAFRYSNTGIPDSKMELFHPGTVQNGSGIPGVPSWSGPKWCGFPGVLGSWGPGFLGSWRPGLVGII